MNAGVNEGTGVANDIDERELFRKNTFSAVGYIKGHLQKQTPFLLI